MYPVRKVVLPSDLKGAKNGKLSNKVLVAVGSGHLHHRAAAAWVAMVAAAKKDGIVLKPTSKYDLYRPYENQRRTFITRFQLENNGSKVTRIWEGRTWYLKKGFAPVAVPGTSNHGWGLAVDVANSSGPTLAWLKKHALKFGFSWEVRTGPNAEPWHLRYFLGDQLPKALRGSPT